MEDVEANENEDEENEISKRPITPASIQKDNLERDGEIASEHNR